MTGKLLPSGRAIDVVKLPKNSLGLSSIEVSLIDAANPFVFVRASDLGLRGNELPSVLSAHADVLMAIRCAAAVVMGLALNFEAASMVPGTPKICLCGSPSDYTTTSGRHLLSREMDINVRPFSMGAPHPSLQMTGAVCLAAACAVPGAIPCQIVGEARALSGFGGPLRFAHGSGVIETEADVSVSLSGEVDIRSASVYRTARRLFEGKVSYMAKLQQPSNIDQTPFKVVASNGNAVVQGHVIHNKASEHRIEVYAS
jgi:2-methylaconitate cis-trans-isomerase PrpF